MDTVSRCLHCDRSDSSRDHLCVGMDLITNIRGETLVHSKTKAVVEIPHSGMGARMDEISTDTTKATTLWKELYVATTSSKEEEEAHQG